MTQKESVLQLLNQAEWVCGTVFQQNYIPEYRTRINELRKDGFIVEALRCTQHQHKGMMQEWSLRPKDDRNPVQEKSPRINDSVTSQPISGPTGNYAYYPPPELAFCCLIAKASENRMHARGCETQKVT